MPGPLEGIKVLDMCAFINGPSATGQMCEQGAEVLKIEQSFGESMRLSGGGPGIYFAGFELYNRGKRSMTLALKHPGSREVMKRLVQWADVLAENFTPGVMDRLNLGYDVVKAWNPKIIYASNSGFGPTGEWAERPSYDGMAQGFTGVLTNNGGGPSHEPRPVGWTFSDVVGGNYFYSAILAALVARERTGKGNHVICSQAGATLYFQRVEISQVLDNAGGKSADDGKHSWQRLAFQGAYRAADGKGVVVSATKLDQLKRFVVDTLGRPDILTPALTKRWPVARPADCDKLRQQIQSVVGTKPVQHWIDKLVANKVPCSPVSTYYDLSDQSGSVGKHMHDNGYIVDVHNRDFGDIAWVGTPSTFSNTPNADPTKLDSWHSPYIGEHTDEMLSALGFTASEAAGLKSTGVVPAPKGPFTQENSKAGKVKYAAKMKARKAAYRAALKSKL